jgi:hypothetical protein
MFDPLEQIKAIVRLQVCILYECLEVLWSCGTRAVV